MHKKKITLLALVSLTTLSLSLHAEEASSDPAESATAASSAPASAAEVSETGRSEALSAMQERWRERDARYEELKQRAKEVGVMLPEDPPWKSARQEMMPGLSERMQRHKKMMSMSPEERMAIHDAHREEARVHAEERGFERPDRSSWEAARAAREEEWAKHKAAIDGMSDEERAACHAMHRRHMDSMPERPMMRGPATGPGMMGPGGMQPGWAPGAMGPGYGYGPNPYAPAQNFWDPNR
ncbi:MAG: hypothetical protein P8166_03815 [Candidatus Thiodiazotropha sp.]